MIVALLLVVHVMVGLGAGLVSAGLRSRPDQAAQGELDAAIALAIPIIGPLAVLAAIAFELAFRRQAALAAPDLTLDPPRLRLLDPVEELRIGTTVEPVADVLARGTLEEVDRALRRLVRSDRPSSLLLVRDALQSDRLDVRVRVRGLIVRVEDRLIERARMATSPLERARASRALACLSSDPVRLRDHVVDAVAAYEEALAADPGGTAGGELGELLLRMGDLEGARETLTGHLGRHPDDLEARLCRAQASLRAADLPAARDDCSLLHRQDPE
jgi:hypothetical protein